MTRATAARTAVLAALFSLATAVGGLAPALAAPQILLTPLPRAVSTTDDWTATLRAVDVRWSAGRSAALDRAAARFQLRLRALTGAGGDAAATASARLVLDVRCAQPGKSPVGMDVDESYRLVVSSNGATLSAVQPAGVLRGLTTLAQLARPAADGLVFQTATVEDSPRFKWRGLMLDVSRHFLPIETLKREIDAMEFVKLNVLHMHLTDTEGFRLESLKLPRLQALGSNGQFYTQAQIRGLIAYARDRGVRIVPEVDVPAHTRSLLKAYPALSAGAGEQDDSRNYAEDVLDPSNPAVYKALDALFGEVSTLFPDAYVHIGGDEVTGTIWQRSPRVQAFMKARGLRTNAELQSYFTRRVHAILKRHRKIMIGWDEIIEGDLAKDAVVQSWRSSKMTARATARGHATIVSAGFYLDWMESSAKVYAIDPLDPTATGLTAQQWAALNANGDSWGEASRVDPLPPLTSGQAALVLGGEAALWTETVTDEMIDGVVWPQLASISERLWSGAEMRDPTELYRRLIPLTRQLESLGLRREFDRARMVGRIAPEASTAVGVVVRAVEPVKNLAHWRSFRGRKDPPQVLNTLADAATAESLEAKELEADVEAAIVEALARAGARPATARIRATMAAWIAQAAPFEAAAAGSDVLKSALPVSRDLAALGALGLEAVEALGGAAAAPALRSAATQDLFARQRAGKGASADFAAVFTRTQPTADLIISGAPAIERLVKAAAP